MKYFIFLVLILGGSFAYAQREDCIAGIKDPDWNIREAALDCISSEGLAKPEMQQAVLDLVEYELRFVAKWYRDDESGKKPAALGEGHGEYLVTLQLALFEIKDNPKTMDALLESLTISGWNIDARIVEVYGEKLVSGLIRVFNGGKIRNESKYRIIGMVARLNKAVQISDDSRRQLRKIVVAGLSSPYSFTKEVSMETAVSVGFDDDEIITKIEKLALKKALKEPAEKALVALRASRGISVSSTTTEQTVR